MINPSKSRDSAQRALVCAIATCGVACNEPTYTPFYDSADLADGGPQVNNDAGASASPSTADGKPSQTPMPATRGSNTDSPATSDDEARPTSEPAAPTQAGRPTPDTGENPNDAGPAAPIPTQPSSNSTAEIGDACLSESPVPTSFERNCAGCHNDAGEQIGSAPNLFTFEGTADEFQQRVRMGGERMPSFDTQTLSDDDLSAIVDFFEAPINDANSETSTACAGKALVGDTCSGVTVPIVPLYASAEAGDTAQILTTNSDGSLVLRAGGRVRGRHEHEADFSPFHTQYFEHRSYTFIVEDTIPAGGNTIKVTWLPIADAAADQVINLRYWYTGDGNVFHTNVGMTRIEPMHWEHTADHNARDDREIRIGDRFDFEFGVFYDPDQVDGRTSYYSDTFRYVVGSGKLTAFDSPDDRAKSGGDTTIPYIFVEPELYFEQMALNIQGDDAQRFLEGRRLFHTDFVTGEHTDPNNPPFEEQASKAGPLANQTSCSGCHEHNGRGAPPASGEAAETLVFKTFDASSTSNDPLPAPKYGRQLQTLSQDGFDPEGEVNVTFTAETLSLPDGDEVELQRPSYVWDGDPSLLSPRLPRPVIGLGLLEAISEQTLLGLADAEDCNADGISGRPNLVPDPATGDLRLGRFGWKAGKVSVRHQVADALQLDLGITTSLFTSLDCGSDADCPASDAKELSDEALDRLESYMRLVSVPPERDTENDSVRRGQDAFMQVGCARCHIPTLTTSALHPLLELRNQVIHPYTDLLLHDLGADLADAGAGEYTALASEWRTPPLWGLGLASSVNGDVHLLHDGRARTALEAILWHGGEAESARDAFVNLDSAARADLLAFLDSL